MASVAVYRGPQRGYSLTDEDVAWLARAFVGECGEDCTREEAQYHFWCWMDRFLLFRGGWNSSSWSFTDLLRAHSQAINPLWMTPGESKCAQYPTYCDATHIARRRRVCAYTVAQLSGFGVYRYALEAQSGNLDRPTSEPMYDFAACTLVEKQGRPCTGIRVKGQCFLTYECLKDSEKRAVLPGNVEVDWPAKKIGVTALSLLFGAAVVWALMTLKPWERFLKG